MITIGLDIGYGVVKAVTADKVVTFPSVAGHAREIKFQQEEIALRHPGDQIVDDDGRWFVGDLALEQLPPGELLRLRGRTANEMTIGNVFRQRMAKVAIGKLLTGIQDGGVVHIRLCSGLPVDHMPDAEDLKAALKGQHLIKTDCTHLIANITDVMVMPQPYGTVFSHLINENGEVNDYYIHSRTGVCDVGTYTVDIVLDEDGDFIDAESGSVESGVYTAHERIAAALERDYRQKMPFRIIEEVLRTGCFRAKGQPVNYKEEVEAALEPLRSATLNLLSEKWKGGTIVDVIYVAGGGAELVFDTIKAVYPQAELERNPQLSNARGYLNYARFKGKARC